MALIPMRRTGFPEIEPIPHDDNVEMQPDGGAIVDLRPAKARKMGDSTMAFDANLALDMDEMDLDSIASELIDAINDDDRSRSQWLQGYERSIDLLGMTIDEAQGTGVGGLQRPSIRAPLLLEACIRLQASARGELLPADGPVKVKIADTENAQKWQLARAFEQDMNHYLTTTATEYYPDFDRMLFHVAFAGCAFRKIYFDPLRGRPVSESVYAPDLIVSQDITDLENASRVTHRIQMRQSVMRRMQILGVYRDIDLIQPSYIDDPIGTKIKESQGIAARTDRPEDQPYDVLECYCEIDLKGHEHMDGGEYSGLPLPYQVTVERSSRKILSIRRNWRENDPLMRAVPRFVKYGMGSGLGFYDLGFAHILGNTTRTLTAIWRLLIEAGMFNNFPGFLLKKGARVGTTNIQVGPGQAREIETGSADDIRQALMPLPYKEPSAVLMQFAQLIEESARRIAGMGEIQVGEGKQEAPVGTTLALIEQAQKTMQSVHKRLHQAQQIELRLLQELFAKNPKSLWSYAKSPARIWQAAQEVSDFDLVPASDPNVSSQMERIMKAQGLVQLAMANPDIYDKMEVHRRALQALGFDDIDSIIKPPAPNQAPPDPKIVAAQINAQTKMAQLEAQQRLEERRIAAEERESQIDLARDFADSQDRAMDRATREKVALLKLQETLLQAQADAENDYRDLVNDNVTKQQTHQFQALKAGMDHAFRLQQHEDTMNQKELDRRHKLDLEKAKAATKRKTEKPKAKKGINGYAHGGRVEVEGNNLETPVVHVHPQVVIQEAPKPRMQREVQFVFDGAGNVTGAKVIETPEPVPEVEVVFDDGDS